FLVDVLDARDRRGDHRSRRRSRRCERLPAKVRLSVRWQQQPSIRPNIRVSSSVATLLAVDADDPKAGSHGNGKVRYSILSPPEETLPFHLDRGHRTPRAGAAAATQSPVWPAAQSADSSSGRRYAGFRIDGNSDGDGVDRRGGGGCGVGQFNYVCHRRSVEIVADKKPKAPGAAGSGGGGSSDSLLIAAGLASVTCAFVLILGLGVGAIVCRRRCLVALTGQSHLQHHQHHQTELSAASASSAPAAPWQRFRKWSQADLCRGSTPKRCSPTAAVDFRDDAAAAEALRLLTLAEAAATVPDCSRLLRDSGSLLRTAGHQRGPNRIDLSDAQIWSGRTSRPAAAAADPQLTYITLMACEQHGNSQQAAAAAAAEPVAEEKKLRIWSGPG
uniref:Cadherin domain-containing protein n=1 Tax=Macrostomum lignano TaxID=282301 RepID=A0A1I8FL94_9PLAT